MSSDEESIEVMQNVQEIEEDDERTNTVFMETATEEITTEETTANNESDKTVVKPKRVIRNPQPKLNEQTLMGPKGLSALESYFDRVNFKGKGHEEHDLNMLLKTYEYWCHRLFPKYPFDSCIARLETLGFKRAVVTNIKKIRMGMTNEDADKSLQSDEELDTSTPNDGFVNEINDPSDTDPFDQLLPRAANIETSTNLSEDQLEQIRLNKEKAENIRKKKLLEIRAMSSSLLQTNTQQSENIFVESMSDSNINTTNVQEIDNRLSSQMIADEIHSNETTVTSEFRIENEFQSEPFRKGGNNGRDAMEHCELHNRETSNSLEEKLINKNIEERNCKDSMHESSNSDNDQENLRNQSLSDEDNDEADLDQILNIINVDKN